MRLIITILLVLSVFFTGCESQNGLITEEVITLCAQDSDCIVVDYNHCCGATKKAINKKYLREYDQHPEWQTFDNPEVCAVIGACLDDSRITQAECIEAADGQCWLVF